ncbi:MAG: helix-turn-helix domain-containing protein [Muribaculaceae bacterium]|nr:helix-turn-helix domain-containing protein [Muribaculaceae bacterium]
MDIISRLKTYLNSMNISNSQFADTCGIPRPTLSQLLNGRNKKISDEIISKIHDTYPSLSVLWLLFGEGQMMNHENMQFSEGSNEEISDNFNSYNTGVKPVTNTAVPQNSVQISDSNRKTDTISDVFGSENISQLDKFDLSALTNDKGEIDSPSDSGKRITNIVVFYSDNSFQSFKPVSD